MRNENSSIKVLPITRDHFLASFWQYMTKYREEASNYGYLVVRTMLMHGPTIFYALDYRSVSTFPFFIAGHDTVQKTFPFLPSAVEAVVHT